MANNMIYDCFMFFNEIEVLELRMMVMDPIVDKYVVVESPYTHSGKPKRLFFDEIKSKFPADRIIHIIDTNEPLIGAWENENSQRNLITDGLTNSNNNDIVIISDVDEIPNPDFIKENLHLLKDVGMFSLKQKMFYYYVNMMISSNWRGSSVSTVGNMISPQHMRNKRNSRSIAGNGGWHYSYLCDTKKIITKLNSFAHTEYNTKEFRNKDHIKLCMNNGKDLFNRNKKIKKVPIEGNSPECMKEFLSRYPHFIKS